MAYFNVYANQSLFIFQVNGKLLCWLCTCAYKRALLKAHQEGRIHSKKRPHERSHHRDHSSAHSAKKPSRGDVSSKRNHSEVAAVSAAGLDIPEKAARTGSSGGGSGNGSIGLGSVMAPAVISIDPNSADHVVAMTTLKERIASLEKRLQFKDKELLEKDKLVSIIARYLMVTLHKVNRNHCLKNATTQCNKELCIPKQES